jgi:pyruvate/2-oxoglutarate/acetoin dehydrogenase E1 component/TPP-dependent pyruvate/acetoin dehydrogenase alpha subunit
MISKISETKQTEIVFDTEEVLADYKLAFESRQVSLIGRREVLSGKAKFGIFGDGKEVPQIAMAKVFQPGDFRSGYYRDQTLLFALGAVSIQEFFAQLYAHADVAADPSSAGRSMNAHFSSRMLEEDGSWKPQTTAFNLSADLSPTGSQMPRLVGLAYASKLYRQLDELKDFHDFSNNGNEIAFGTIGNASCAEGMFWEAINAIGILQCPTVLSIWDDGYGISVPNKHQLLKEDISRLLEGFQRDEGAKNGYDIYTVRAWDYSSLIETYRKAAVTAREEHVPAIIHVVDVTQPLGHSTSGSHERYKTPERMAWESEFDCIKILREWIIEQGLATSSDLDEIETAGKKHVEETRLRAWNAYLAPIRSDVQALSRILESSCLKSPKAQELMGVRQRLLQNPVPYRRDIMVAIREALLALRDETSQCKHELIELRRTLEDAGEERYGSHLHSQSSESALTIQEVQPHYSQGAKLISGFQLLNAGFEVMLANNPRVMAFGEDVGHLGDVNQGFADLQEKFGELRVSDTGIRETTIIGQAIGMAVRGLRPIAEIQYLDYLLYALQIISDDLATLHWRTKGGQKAPVIIRTRGHRLEGIWHSGSPMAGVINFVRGVHVLVPRNMTRAVGFYNTLLQGDEPAIVVEVLNGYRLKERLPDNLAEMTTPLGVPEILRSGEDVTVVTYGACCRLALEAANLLGEVGIDTEVIDVQSLLPFDVDNSIVESLKKTGRILFLDEDVPGGATAYMMQAVLEKQGGFWWLDSEPRTLTAKAHRPAYGSDGDYWSKPTVEQIFDAVYEQMSEADPASYPDLYA